MHCDRQSWLWLALCLVLAGCGTPSTDESETGADASESGDGDGDGEGDGDGDSGDGDGDPVPAPSVLLIGNSYTAVNNLPGILREIAEASPTPLTTDALAVAGARVIDHLANPELANLLAQDFDVIVVQGQSLEPVFDYPTFESGVVQLAGMVGDARVVLYQTWPRKADSPELLDLGLTAEEMWMGLESGYAQAALASGSEVAAVGEAWVSLLELGLPIELYQSDASHPTPAGSYLAGCVLFGKIAGQPCTTSTYSPDSLTPDQVVQLQIVADTVNGFPGP